MCEHSAKLLPVLRFATAILVASALHVFQVYHWYLYRLDSDAILAHGFDFSEIIAYGFDSNKALAHGGNWFLVLVLVWANILIHDKLIRAYGSLSAEAQFLCFFFYLLGPAALYLESLVYWGVPMTKAFTLEHGTYVGAILWIVIGGNWGYARARRWVSRDRDKKDAAE